MKLFRKTLSLTGKALGVGLIVADVAFIINLLFVLSRINTSLYIYYMLYRFFCQ